MKIVTVIGARPQFIKAASFSARVSKTTNVEEVLIHTGQHFDENMSTVFFQELEIPAPKYRLDIHSLSHGAMTGRMLEEIEKILLIEKPDWVLVYGDTNSTLAGALAASKLHIPVAHVEAGLRSQNMKMPEEVNRIITDRISEILLCPTQLAIDNLLQESYPESKIKYTGDIMYESLLKAKNIIDKNPAKIISPHLSTWRESKYVLATIHRAENTDNIEHLKNIISALNSIQENIAVLLPLHPRTRHIINQHAVKCNFQIIDPVGYFDMVFLMMHSNCILTDSGGIQKEAYFLKKPCITLREETEWKETLSHKCNQLVGNDTQKIVQAFLSLSSINFDFSEKYYGDGNASEIILDQLINQATK